MEDELNRPDTAAKDTDLLRALWIFFSSMKTAIVLLLVLAVASVIGTVIPQGGPREMYVGQYGELWGSLVAQLRLGDVFHSGWYGFLLAMVSINLLVCSINRFKMAWRRAFQPKVTAQVEQIARMQVADRVTFRGSVDDAESRVLPALKRSGYSISAEKDGDDVCIHAAKGRMGIWGPYLTHLSLLVIFAGYILGNRMGFEGFAYIPEGTQTAAYYPKDSEQQRNLGFDVKLLDFTIEHDANHSPTAYKSHLQILDKGKRVAEKTIDVNHPLTYKGITFYQSGFGIEGLVLKITNPDGGVTEIPVRMQTQMGDHGQEYVPELMPVDVKTGGKTWTFFVHNFVPDYVGEPAINASDLPINPAAQVYVNEQFPKVKDAWDQVGWVTTGQPADYKGHKVELERVIDYTGLQVASNPALPIVYAGFVIMLLGVFASFYVHHRIIRVRVSASDGNAVLGAMSRVDTSVVERDVARVRDALKQ